MSKYFQELTDLLRLSSDSIYRLMKLSPHLNAWHEETLTDILFGQLTGAEYTIEAPCPAAQPHRCDWIRSQRSVRAAVGGLRMTTKAEEASCGADLTLKVENPEGDDPLYIYVQAKRIRDLDSWKHLDRRLHHDSPQARALFEQQFRESDAGEAAVAFYLFYVQTTDPHEVVVGRCPVHTTASDCSAMLVGWEEVHGSGDIRRLTPRQLLETGTPLRCLADTCQGREVALSAVDRIRELGARRKAERPESARKPSPRTSSHTVAADPQSHGAVTATDNRAKRERLQRDRPGSILMVHLSPWIEEEATWGPPDWHRHGQGWRTDITEDELRNAARMWWRMSEAGAAGIEYLVAWAEGEVKACYSVTGRRYEAELQRWGFVVESVSGGEERKLLRVCQQRIAQRAKGARNPIMYVTL